MGSLQERGSHGNLIRSVEIVPAKTLAADDIEGASQILSDVVDMVTVPENPMGKPGIDPVATLIELTRGTHIVPVPHISPRDKNSLYIRSQVLTALKFGIRKFFVIGGDKISDEVGSKEVREIDIFETISLIRNTASNAGINVEVGTALNPYRPNELEFFKKKKEAKASFFITQVLTSPASLVGGGFSANGVGLLAGFMPIKKRSTLQFLEKLGVPVKGTRFERISESEDPLEESIRAIMETVDEMKHLITGVHIMPMGDYATAKRILECI